MYAKYIKRILDFFLSLTGLIILSPLLLALTVIGTVKFKGNPFFTQPRPGRNERIFRLIKFRSMTDAHDAEGNLLPDAQRLTRYGHFLRATSADELPELLNIVAGQMSFVGPRPLAVQYLPYYTEQERLRHSVRPGLTGLAQINGRNETTWEDRFAYDLQYVSSVSFGQDVRILFRTVAVTLDRSGIGVRGVDSLPDFDTYRKQQSEKEYESV
ncbi:MAG: sugar transferase [Oscillospiraceae bacterium]|nr:sugar transferase [Oscillospiraceae bacterium]